MNSTMSDSSSSRSEANHVREQAQSFLRLSEEERREFFFQTASALSSNELRPSQAAMAQTPRTMPSTSNLTHLPAANYGFMERRISAPGMGRSASVTSATQPLQRSNSAMSAWHTSSQDASSAYTHYSSNTAPAPSTLQPIAESASYRNGSMVEWSPNDYVTNCIEPASSSSLPLYPQQLQLTSPNLPWGSSPDDSTSPSTPSTTALLTPITHSSNPMSRQSSYNPLLFDDSCNSSFVLPVLIEDGNFPYSFNVDAKSINNCVDLSQFSSFTGPTSEDFLSSVHSSSLSAQALATSEHDMPYLAEDMRRSASATSSEGNVSDTSASSSLCSRQSRREREINAQAAARKIAPKAAELNDEIESAPSNASMARIRSEDGTSKTVGVITKTPYVRPHHPKIMCQHCSERPEGFRGTHELDRHIARAHAPSRKGYICIDGSVDRKFLANCKHCKSKKVYGAYYNAAAHLRRAHFHPRKRGRKGKNDEKRGGIGGGDDPPMDFLKMHWIREVEVPNSPSSPASASDDANDNADNRYESTFDLDAPASYPPQLPLPAVVVNQVQMNANQFVGYDMSMPQSELVSFDATNFPVYDSMPVSNELSSFEFDAYMGN
ncbi:hypothetical protein BKA63DRAFT_510223 [Paraphoma chrysanthemicola]|nr:hypothetical protein BKA63DRAFT_510223 [Paraphoma chrysanthemicola]